MFEQFTDRARNVIILAQAAAKSLNHSYIGTEHLLIAMAEDGEGTAGRALRHHGLTTESIRLQVEEIVGRPVNRLAVNDIEARRDRRTIHLAMAGPAADDLAPVEVRRIDGVHHLNHLARGHLARSVRGIVRRMTLEAAHAQGGREQAHRSHEFIHGNTFEHLDVLEGLI